METGQRVKSLKKICFGIFIIVTLFIVLSTFVTFNLKMVRSIGGHKFRMDYFRHLGIYGLLSYSFFCSFKKTLKLKNSVFYLLAGLVLSFGFELLQMLVPARSYNLTDVLFNGIGLLAGFFVYQIFKKNKSEKLKSRS